MNVGERIDVRAELVAVDTDYVSVQVTCANRIYYAAATVRLSYETRGALRELVVDAVRSALDEAFQRELEKL